MDEKTIKRVMVIGSDLVLLDRRRNEIEVETKKLLSEVHRITRPRNRILEGEPAEPEGDDEIAPKPVTISSVRLVRNNVPTLRSRVLQLFMRHTTLTKFQVADALGITAIQAQYCLTALERHNLVGKVAHGVRSLTDHGKQECERLFPTPDLVVESEAVDG
jgi:predicted transcriptional regulator